ncbi:hypothetical protein [Methanococcoides alaskense]|uniref:Uncharacterized protein n=1 Tax=Methanococcoides alaskense TaxID=325778 RepID=A0AA90ZDQ3_9EURY|nr:hypothetical protein [Methanococcoides alaskense]MDA0524220.1 hypothetical protein [Methanococcoides alaskense]MDR6223657.1 hypothetical protein [Methanococcoides alaskense]
MSKQNEKVLFSNDVEIEIEVSISNDVGQISKCNGYAKVCVPCKKALELFLKHMILEVHSQKIDELLEDVVE